MQISAVNFPWVGRNPFRLAGMIWLFAFVIFSPMFALGVFSHRWWILFSPPLVATAMGVIFLLVSLGVRSIMRRRENLAPRPSADEEFRSDCLVVKGMFKTPGIAVIQGGRLFLTPAFGAVVDVPLSQVDGASEKRLFNGKLLLGQSRGFWLGVPGFWRLGVAIEEAAAFRSILERHGVRVS